MESVETSLEGRGEMELERRKDVGRGGSQGRGVASRSSALCLIPE